jgi:hypothetical protein
MKMVSFDTNVLHEANPVCNSEIDFNYLNIY